MKGCVLFMLILSVNAPAVKIFAQQADVKSEEVKKKVFEKSAGKCSKKSAEKSAKWLINVMIR